MLKFLDELLKLGTTLFLLVALLPFYFFVLGYLKGVIKSGKPLRDYCIYIDNYCFCIYLYISY